MQEYFDIDLEQLEREIAIDYAARKGAVIVAGDGALEKYILAIRHHVADKASVIDEKIKQVVCVDLDYCSRKNSEGLTLARQLVDLGIMTYFLIPVPPLKLASYVVRAGYFDRACSC